MKKLLRSIKHLFVKHRIVDNNRTVAEVVSWLETHGIERGTAAQVQGFLAAYGFDLPQISLCNYGLTYTFKEFREWFYSEPEDYTPKIGQICIFWDDKLNQDAKVAALIEIDTNSDFPFMSNSEACYQNCIQYDNLAQYRTVLNTAEDMEIPLPHLVGMDKYKNIEQKAEE